MKKNLIALSAAALLLSAAALPVHAQNVAVVNGKPVPQSRMDTLRTQIELQAERTGQPVPPEVEEQLREEIITREVFVQEAERRKLQSSAEFKAKLELARQSVLIGELFEDFQKNNPVTDEEARAEYDSVVQAQAEAVSGQEYKSSHILVETEDEAKALIEKINAGGDFAQLAKSESKDPGSGANGGSLGWANPSTYVPEFAEAMQALEKGSVTQEPVESQFGFHIIRLDDVREAQAPEPPAFEEVKDQIKQQLGQQKLMTFQQELRAQAKVE